MVLQLLDLAPGLEDAEVILDTPAKGVPAKLSVDRQFFPRAVPGAALEHAFEHTLRQLVILRV